MKKLLLGVVLLLIVAIGAAGTYLYFNGTSLMRQAVVDYGPEITGTSVTLDGVSLLPFNGEAGINGLQVGSPAGFSAPYTFKVQEVDLKLQPATLLDDVLVIDSVDIIAPSVVYEPKGKSSNIEALQGNVEKYTAGGDTSSGVGGPEKVIINRLVIRQPEVVVYAGGLIGEQSVTAEDVVLTGIGADSGGVPPGDVATIVMAELQPAVMSALRSKAGEAILSEVMGGALDDILPTDKVKDVLGGDVGKSVKGLLGLGKKE